MIESRWLILAVLFIARFALGYQFQSAGSVAPFLVHDLSVDYAAIGLLVGVFLLPGVVISLPSGYLSRNLGDKSAVATGMALLAVGGVLSGATDSYNVLFAGRVVSGIGGAILVVVMSKMLVDWFASKELFFSMAVFIIGWPVGIAAGQATQSELANVTSWHMVFLSSAALVALAMVLVLLFYRTPIELRQSTAGGNSRLTAAEATVICLAGMAWMFLNGAYLIMLSFGPAHLMELGVTVTQANSIVSVMSWVMVFALPLGGYVAGRYNAPNLVMIVGLAVSVILCGAIPFLPSPILTFGLFGTALGFATAVVSALPAEVLPPRIRAPGFGLYYLWYFVGMPILIPIAGFLRDRTGSVTASLIYATGLLVCCLLLLGLFRFTQSRWLDRQYAGDAAAGRVI
jgi:MFS family permease